MAGSKVAGKAENSEVAKSSGSAKKKTNKGCWILGAVGCGIVVLICGLITFFFVLVAALGSDVGGSVSEDIIHQGTEGKIAVVRVEGVIMQGDDSSSMLGSTVGADPDVVNQEIDKALADDEVDAILIKMNSPGGEVVASDLIYQKVLDASEEKTVVTWMSSMGASGGYMVASASDEIVAHPETITGSIGVIMQLTRIEGLYEKVGIETRTFKSGQFKDSEGVFDGDPNGEADQIYQDLVDESHENFVDAIVDARDMSEREVELLADGRIYSGTQAYENGLVDSTGQMEDAIDRIEEIVGKDDMTVVQYSSGGFWADFYEYQAALANKLSLKPDVADYGARMYYLLEM